MNTLYRSGSVHQGRCGPRYWSDILFLGYIIPYDGVQFDIFTSLAVAWPLHFLQCQSVANLELPCAQCLRRRPIRTSNIGTSLSVHEKARADRSAHLM